MWFDEKTGFWVGMALGVGLAMWGGLLAVYGQSYAKRNVHYVSVLACVAALLLAGGICLLVGTNAVFELQERHVWYPFMIAGVVVCWYAPLLFVRLRGIYRDAEERIRRMEAEQRAQKKTEKARLERPKWWGG